MTRTELDYPAPRARWSNRLALFGVLVVIAAAVLHRAAGLPTPVALNLFAVGLASAAGAMLCGLIAAIQIWHGGRTGAWNVGWGLILSTVLFAWPAAYWQLGRNLPRINDISTDLYYPPKFNALVVERSASANPAAYPGERFAREQAQAYPDLHSVTVDRPADEAFEIVVDLVRSRRGLNWRIVAEEPPVARGNKPGMIEAVERTLVLGFYDDIAIRIESQGRQSKIDIRSASRYGSHDFGQNASRVRRFVRELQSRLDLAIPGGIAGRGIKGGRAAALVPKRLKDRNQAQAVPKGAPDRAPPDARRGRAPKARPPG